MTGLSRIDPLDAVAIHCGHRELLATLRELIAGVEHGRDIDAESLRGAIAFLRQGVVPFARREEQVLAPAAELRECVAFEHAFLEAEIDRLAREAAPVLREDGAGGESDAAARAAVRRTLLRIETVLELHGLREEDLGVYVPGADAEAAGGFAAVRAADTTVGAVPAPASSGTEAMTEEDAERFLRAHEWGVLCTIGAGAPYGVPVSYGYSDGALFIATGPGRKADNLRENGAVCLTVAEVADGRLWRCVVVTGQARWQETHAERLAAIWALVRRGGKAAGLQQREWRRLAKARLLRITPTEITGRQRGR